MLTCRVLFITVFLCYSDYVLYLLIVNFVVCGCIEHQHDGIHLCVRSCLIVCSRSDKATGVLHFFSPHHLVDHTHVALDNLHNFGGDIFIRIVWNRSAVVAVLNEFYGRID